MSIALRLSSLSFWCLLVLFQPLMAGCAEKRVGVAVSAINYTGEELGMFLFKHPESGEVAGGPGLKPFEGGGTMCCYALPMKWRPGIKATVIYEFDTGPQQGGRREVLLEVPPYPGKGPGMLWALFYEDGSVEVVSSDYDPGHAKWPGRIKHWPVPSLEYRQKEWAKEIARLREQEAAFVADAKNADAKQIADAWQSFKDPWYARHDPDVVEAMSRFSGPDDPKFVAWYARRIQQNIDAIRKEIAELEGHKQ